MKSAWLKVALVFCVFLMAAGCGKDKEIAKGPMPQEFSATMASTSAGQTITSKIYMKPGKFRADSEMAGSSTIVRQDLNKAWTIMTSQKTYMEMEGVSDIQHQTISETVKGEVSRKELGRETVAGHSAIKYELTTKADGKVVILHQWWATDINFPVKTAADDGSWVMEYRDINIGSQPDSLFDIPSGYNKLSIPGLPGGMKVGIPGEGTK